MRRMKYVVSLVVTAAVCFGLGSLSPAAESPAAGQPKHYASPNEVFDAYRAATARRDARTLYWCSTPAVRQEMVFESLLACATQRPERVAAVLKRHGYDEAKIMEEYYKRYQAKYGLDLKKATAEYEERSRTVTAEYVKEHPESVLAGGAVGIPNEMSAKRGTPPPRDDELAEQATADAIADKVGFIEDVSKMLDSKDPPPTLTRLERVTIRGDTATGSTSITTTLKVYHSGGGVERTIQTTPTTVHFRKSKDGWLIERQEAAAAVAVPPTIRRGR